ncbi:hypothetical protein DRN73_03350 [Candidatus Pacearchaeota archaeon]|nr:MAG: hypothetical protein DRN73_03350 [Candidatus Pacearchaeota archaeon]
MFKNIGKLFIIKPSELSIEEISFYKDLGFKNFIFFSEHFEGNFFEYYSNLKDRLKDLYLLAIDQEGGKVCRIKGDFESPFEIAQKYIIEGEKIVHKWAGKIAKILKKYNLNLNLAPCVDLADEKAPDFLKLRTFGKDPELVEKLSEIFLKIHLKYDIYTCAKHFPGLKDIKIDPHFELPFKKSFDEESLEVYKFLIKKGILFIMTTHLVLNEIDKNPITFSQKIIKFLRENLNYKGFILTDDLNMGALEKWELQERIILGLASGHNLLIYCGKWQDFQVTIFDIKTEIEKSLVLKERIKESYFLLDKFF